MMKHIRYSHDCDVCRFVGNYEDFDLYICLKGEDTEVIARYGNYGPDYYSIKVSEIPTYVQNRWYEPWMGYALASSANYAQYPHARQQTFVEKVRDVDSKHGKISAIKFIREHQGEYRSLRDAKDYYDFIMKG